MIKQTKKEYVAPKVEMIEARVEKGFLTSGITPESQSLGSSMENYVKGTGNGEGGYLFN